MYKRQVLRGQTFLVNEEQKTSDIVPEELPLEIVYEDEVLIVVNKARGMVVHPAAGNHKGTLVNALLAYGSANLSDVQGYDRPGIVHRLDNYLSLIHISSILTVNRRWLRLNRWWPQILL